MKPFDLQEAMEIVQYWLKYKGIDRNQIMIIEVPDIVNKY